MPITNKNGLLEREVAKCSAICVDFTPSNWERLASNARMLSRVPQMQQYRDNIVTV